MTRISAGVHAKELCDAHLKKERIEILRIPNNIKSGKSKFDLKKIPNEFKLGTGHVKFFENKIKYLHNRYLELTEECQKRGFKTTDFSDSFHNIPPSLWNDYNPSGKDRKIVQERIAERLKTMKNIKFSPYI